MARIRNLKPGFFKDADLFDAEKASGLPLRLAYEGLWCVADREGRFKWKPREIKTDVLPYDDVDMGAVMDALVKARFIFKYKANGFEYGFIPTFKEHQFINKNEAPSTIPAPPENSNDYSEIVTHPELLVVLDTDILDTDTEGSSAPQADAPPSKPKSVRASRWPKEETPSEKWLDDAEAKRRENSLPVIDLRLEAEKFRNYWAGKSGGNATKVDWHLTWINWALGAKEAQNGHGQRLSAHEKFLRGGALSAGYDVGNANGHAGANDRPSGPSEPALLPTGLYREASKTGV